MLWVEIASDRYSQEQGLMFREDLGAEEGMVFAFGKPQVLKFWGMNTYIPLDVAFVDEDNRIVKIDRIKPLCLKAVSSDKHCVMAIEANEGFFKSNGIKVGDKVDLANDPFKGPFVTFEQSEGK